MIALHCCRPLVMLIIFTASALGSPSLDSNTGLVDAVTRAFAPAELSELVGAASRNVDAGTDQGKQSLQRLQQLLDLGADAVLALLRVLDRSDIGGEQLAPMLAQAVIDYHAVQDRLAGLNMEDSVGQDLVGQAQASLIAGRFNDAHTLLQDIEDREVALSGRVSGVAPEAPLSTFRHLISAAEAGTALGELAMMQLRYGDATAHFRLAHQRLALLPEGESEAVSSQLGKPSPTSELMVESRDVAIAVPPTAEPPKVDPTGFLAAPSGVAAVMAVPAKSANTRLTSEAMPPPPVLDITFTRHKTGPMHPGVESSHPIVSQEPGPVAIMSAEILALLLHRGDNLLALGDISAARRLYERAAATGDSRAAIGVGKTYDPLFLSAIGARGIQGDPAAAANWYRRAIDLGDQSAVERLNRMMQARN